MGDNIQMLTEQPLWQTGSYTAVVCVAVSKAIHRSGLMFQRGGMDGGRAGEEVGSCQARSPRGRGTCGTTKEEEAHCV